MRRFLGLLLITGAELASSLAVAQGAAGAAAAQVRTTAGVVEAIPRDGVAAYRGIPYAAPPVGALRWHAPEKAAAWSSIRRADTFGKACPQDRKQSLDQAGDPGPTDEDCLFANVWTPRPDPAGRLPVMVWIHGGAFTIGAGSQAIFDGAALARRGAVVVTFNYRLGPLGFFVHPALEAAVPGGPANFGLLDQVAALAWVRDNIAAFGGDPGNVTIFGESAGGQSVLSLFTSPLARGLFQRGIAQSAYGIPSHPRAKARTVGIAVATAAGAAGADATLAQLRALPAEAFVPPPSRALTLAPSPIVGDAVLPMPILAAFQQGKEAPLPLIVGSNSDDASVISAFGVDPALLVQKLGGARILVKPLYPGVVDQSQLGREVARDVAFGAFARRIAYLHTARAPTWRYYFSRLPTAAPKTMPGVAHGGEIASVFGAEDGCGCLIASLSEADRASARRVGDYWLAFARGGAPDPANDVAWPRDGRRRALTMEFGDEFVVRENFMRRRLDAFIAALNLIGAAPAR